MDKLFMKYYPGDRVMVLMKVIPQTFTGNQQTCPGYAVGCLLIYVRYHVCFISLDSLTFRDVIFIKKYCEYLTDIVITNCCYKRDLKLYVKVNKIFYKNMPMKGLRINVSTFCMHCIV